MGPGNTVIDYNVPERKDNGTITKLPTVPRWSHFSAHIPEIVPINDMIAEAIIAKIRII